jgi:hypothetical protein
MTREAKAALNQNAQDFVRKVVTEVYGQRATNASVKATAERLVRTLPANGSALPTKTPVK